MICLEMSEEEQQILIGVLEECISDLRREIVHTENTGFKERLKRKKNTLARILELLKTAETGSAAS